MMTVTDELNENDLAYRQDYPDLHRHYPYQQYVAYYKGKIVSDSNDFDHLLANLKANGINPKTAMVVRVGDELIEYMDILCNEFNHE